MRTFLVTGGCGFIGSHLCEALLEGGHAVRALDDLSSGSRDNVPDDVEFIYGDIADPESVCMALDGVDGCFHLAAIASVERGFEDWTGTHRVNLSGTITLLDQIRRLRSSRRVPFVYASSAAVYGDPQSLPLSESCVLRPLSSYGADKLGCELHAQIASTVHGIPTVGLRLFNVYGPRQDPKSPYSGVISVFCDRLTRKEPVDIFGDGQQTRDFVFVRDVVKALLQAMTICPPGAPVFNVCTGLPTTIIDLARLIASLSGAPMQPRFRPPRFGEIRHSTGSPAKARTVLGLPDPVGLEDGLAETLEWIGVRRPAAELGLPAR
jgi:UDP-glucose 4-epimerase